MEDDSYFLAVLRYIHQNPVKAGICKKVSAYMYSSYNEFFNNSDLIDGALILSMIPKEDFDKFNNETSFEKCLDIEDKPIVKVTDEQARKIIEKYSKCKSIAEFQKLETKTRGKYLKKFKESGLSIRQISRLTGVSFNIVRKF